MLRICKVGHGHSRTLSAAPMQQPMLTFMMRKSPTVQCPFPRWQRAGGPLPGSTCKAGSVHVNDAFALFSWNTSTTTTTTDAHRSQPSPRRQRRPGPWPKREISHAAATRARAATQSRTPVPAPRPAGRVPIQRCSVFSMTLAASRRGNHDTLRTVSHVHTQKPWSIQLQSTKRVQKLKITDMRMAKRAVAVKGGQQPQELDTGITAVGGMVAW